MQQETPQESLPPAEHSAHEHADTTIVDKTAMSTNQSIEQTDEKKTQPAKASMTTTSASQFRSITWPPPPRERRRPSWLRRTTNIVVIILACLLITSGFVLVLYDTSAQYSTTLSTAATVEAQSTRDVINTAQAQQQGTANALSTAQAGINATATAQSGNVATATQTTYNGTATATAIGNQYTDATNGQPAFNDALSDNNGPGKWDNGGSDTQAACAFKNGQYSVSEAQQDYLQPCIARGTAFTDFTYQVNVMLTDGQHSQAGMLFRVDSTNQSYYFFRIDTDGYYALDVYQSNNQARTIAQGLSSAIMTGLNQSNALAVIAQGSTFILFANSQYLATATDATLTTGKIGVAVVNGGTPVNATFSNAQVWSKKNHK